MSVDRAQQRVDVDERLLVDPGQQLGAFGQGARCSRSTDSSWRACPKLNSRNRVPRVEGAYTPSNRIGIPPARSMSRSSMLSAPAHIPAITVSSLGAGFAAPDLIRGVVIDTFLAMISARPVCSASPSSGTSPASDTRLSSSNRAEPAVNLWETRTESASLELG